MSGLDENGDRRASRQALGDAMPGAGPAGGNSPAATPHGAPRKETLAYAEIAGVAPNLLSLDIYGVAPGSNKPVIIMIHGGGWQAGDKANRNVVDPKADHFVDEGFVFVSINYRLAPDHPFPAHAIDAARATAWIYENVAGYGGDPNRIALMGHSAGAHIAALIATDASYLRASGQDLDIIDGVILLDTAAYDIPALARGPRGLPRAYRPSFGADPATWRRASPITHVAAGKSIPPMILFHTDRRASRAASVQFANALSEAGVVATVHAALDRTHESLNAKIGEDGDRYTGLIDQFLASHAPG
ncbi:MAG: alpha/beta hydrolase [Pseudomonadota bacterium]